MMTNFPTSLLIISADKCFNHSLDNAQCLVYAYIFSWTFLGFLTFYATIILFI